MSKSENIKIDKDGFITKIDKTKPCFFEISKEEIDRIAKTIKEMEDDKRESRLPLGCCEEL